MFLMAFHVGRDFCWFWYWYFVLWCSCIVDCRWLSIQVVILAGLGVVAVGSFPPFAEEICNRFPILKDKVKTLTKIVLSYNVTDQSPMAPSFTTGTFGISISNTDTSLACSDSNTASAKAMDVFKGDMLIVAGQVVMAVQGVYEEKVATK